MLRNTSQQSIKDELIYITMQYICWVKSPMNV